jgi:hypothetical protein
MNRRKPDLLLWATKFNQLAFLHDENSVIVYHAAQAMCYADYDTIVHSGAYDPLYHRVSPYVGR